MVVLCGVLIFAGLIIALNFLLKYFFYYLLCCCLCCNLDKKILKNQFTKKYVNSGNIKEKRDNIKKGEYNEDDCDELL